MIPGSITGVEHGVIEKPTGACHTSTNQAFQWRSRYFKPAVKAIAESRTDLADLATATPYSLRRGGISARLRGENAQSVAEQCGTGLEMLSRHYGYEIDTTQLAAVPRLLDDAQFSPARGRRGPILAAGPYADRARNRSRASASVVYGLLAALSCSEISSDSVAEAQR